MTIHDPETVHRIVYLSRARSGLDEGAVEKLVKSARTKNRKLGITGALLFEQGHFFQILEGPRKEVRSLFRAIQNDERHEQVHLLIEETLRNRQFNGWSLAWNRDTDRTLSEHFRELKEVISSPRSTACDLPSIHKFLIIFHGLLPDNHRKEQWESDRDTDVALLGEEVVPHR